MKNTSTSILAIVMTVLFFTGVCTSTEQTQAEQWKDDIGLNENPRRPWTDKDFLSTEDSFQFGVIADRTGGRRKGVFADGIKKFNLLGPEFVISIGDLIDGNYNWAGPIEQQWDELDAIVDRLDMRFFYLPGNHDLGGPSILTQIWNKRYGRTYYHFVYKNVLFLCINSDDPPYARYPMSRLNIFKRY